MIRITVTGDGGFPVLWTNVSCAAVDRSGKI